MDGIPVEADQFGEAQAGLNCEQQQDIVAAAAPGAAIGRVSVRCTASRISRRADGEPSPARSEDDIGGVLGSAAVKAPMFDFTVGGRHPDVFSSFETFAMLSSTIEDVGVAAFKGQIGNSCRVHPFFLPCWIHSVEARHTTSVRLVVGKSGSEGAFDKPMSKNEVLEAVKPFFV